MPNFSVVIITFNEQNIIEKCVSACKKVTDDIVVIDSFSKDKTVEICEKLGANVIQQKWLGYSEQKNFANKYTKYDWILYIDADEILSDEAIENYKKIEFKNKEIVYKIARLNKYCGKWIKHGRWYPEWRNRLFNKHFAQWNSDIVHEDVEAISKRKFETIKLKGDVLHFSIESKEEHLKKIELYANLSAKKMFNKNKKATFIKRFLSPISRFVVDYFFNLGIIDGKIGFQIAWLSSYETFLKYDILKQLERKNQAK